MDIGAPMLLEIFKAIAMDLSDVFAISIRDHWKEPRLIIRICA
jgi:hypothetical protein